MNTEVNICFEIPDEKKCEDNDGVPGYQTYTGFNRNVLDIDMTCSSVKTHMLLCEMERMLDSFVSSTPKYMVGI
jgi:hypothetical protein